MQKFLLVFVFSLTLKSIEATTKIKKLPLYEIGAGAMSVSIPSYPGSAHFLRLNFPIPSFVYRGKVLRARQSEGIRGVFFENNIMELDFSLDGTFPGKSKDNPAREGMPNLHGVLEFGPKAKFHLYKSKKFKIESHNAIRAAFSSDFNVIDYRGLTFNPFLIFKFLNFTSKKDQLNFYLNFKFAQKKLMSYYYGVSDIQSKRGREAYNAEAGIMDISPSVAYFRSFKNNWSGFVGVIHSIHKYSKNKSSPLHQKDRYTSYVAGVVWHFYHSKEKSRSPVKSTQSLAISP